MVELSQKIRQLLLHIWDPLSIGDNEQLNDEDDALIPRIRH
jgi:hypothetical protein